MRINRVIERTRAEGPGIRLCIWVQGCRHGCKGCYAKSTWDREKGIEVDSLSLVDMVRRNKDCIDGITFLGGEPFDQACELLPIAKAAKNLGLNTIAFSGYLYEELLKEEESHELLRYVDLLIDGPYMEEKQDFSRPLVGSSNQRFIYLTDQIPKCEIENYRNQIELNIKTNGKLEINGMTDLDKLSEIISIL